MRAWIQQALREAAAASVALASDREAAARIEQAGLVLGEALARGRRAWACGNGGSLCDAMHFAEELSGRFRRNRRPLPAAAIIDPAHLTCTANDFGYEQVFSRFLEAHGSPGDALLAISTSGTSANVLAAARGARANGLSVIALTGRSGSPLGLAADVEICTPAGRWSDRVQELQIQVIHLLVELVERQLFPASYADERPGAGAPS
jgi:D-sedoheptulose 7-phosphate isomerase